MRSLASAPVPVTDAEAKQKRTEDDDGSVTEDDGSATEDDEPDRAAYPKRRRSAPGVGEDGTPI